MQPYVKHPYKTLKMLQIFVPYFNGDSYRDYIVGVLLQTPIHHFGNQFVFRPNTRWRDCVTFIVTFDTDIDAVEITVFMRT